MSIHKLICLAHAGGSASSYLRWSRFLDPGVELIPLEYAGRGARSSEALFENMDEAVSDLVNILKPWLADGAPYALFGHSLGALVAYELACVLQTKQLLLPDLLIVSGKNPPHMAMQAQRHLLPEHEFREELESLGGTPRELLKDPAFVEYFLPIARADFKLVETYRLQAGRPKLHTDICTLNGSDDTFVDLGRMEEWGDYSDGEVRHQQFPGGHFYLHEHSEQVVLYLSWLLVQQQAWQPQA